MTNNQSNNVTNADNTTTASSIIQFNPASQLPIKLTGSVNFSTWKAQFSMLMHGHDLFGHLDGTKVPPPRTTGENRTLNPAYNLWFRQDQLIQNALMASVDPTIAQTVADAASAQCAWDALHAAYANKSQSRLFSLRDQLARLNKDTQSMSDYLHRVRALADELTQAGAPLANEELVVQILWGLGSEYREISAAIRARDTPISYEDLYDKLIDFEVFIRHEESKKPAAVAQRTMQPNNYNNRGGRRQQQGWKQAGRSDNQPMQWRNGNWGSSWRDNNGSAEVQCQLCHKHGHEANVCRSKSHNHSEAKENFAMSRLNPNTSWLLESGTSHLMKFETRDMPEYFGTDGITVGNEDEEREVEDILLKLTASNEVGNDGRQGHDLKVFTFASITVATDCFSPENKLGEGGFGPVYKGKLPDGEEIAVKRLSRSSGQGLIEFKNELILIAKLQHMNLVRLLGCCVKAGEKMLIYEYMPNKSLDFFLLDQTRREQLKWKIRFSIIKGIAQGLLYLHRHSRLRIIHRDLKASNILLDGDMTPKISDFGMVRIFGRNESDANTNRVVGTYGYMSPEYAMEGNFSEKSDVYSFGVLLLEIVSGQKNNQIFQHDRPMNLVGYAWELWKEERSFELLDDSIIGDKKSESQALRCIHVGLLCVQEYAAERPTMSDVVSMIGNETLQLPSPKQVHFRLIKHQFRYRCLKLNN